MERVAPANPVAPTEPLDFSSIFSNLFWEGGPKELYTSIYATISKISQFFRVQDYAPFEVYEFYRFFSLKKNFKDFSPRPVTLYPCRTIYDMWQVLETGEPALYAEFYAFVVPPLNGHGEQYSMCSPEVYVLPEHDKYTSEIYNMTLYTYRCRFHVEFNEMADMWHMPEYAEPDAAEGNAPAKMCNYPVSILGHNNPFDAKLEVKSYVVTLMGIVYRETGVPPQQQLVFFKSASDEAPRQYGPHEQLPTDPVMIHVVDKYN